LSEDTSTLDVWFKGTTDEYHRLEDRARTLGVSLTLKERQEERGTEVVLWCQVLMAGIQPLVATLSDEFRSYLHRRRDDNQDKLPKDES
jgi:hypothetical protein